jgi:hypothetical protein
MIRWHWYNQERGMFPLWVVRLFFAANALFTVVGIQLKWSAPWSTLDMVIMDSIIVFCTAIALFLRDVKEDDD